VDDRLLSATLPPQPPGDLRELGLFERAGATEIDVRDRRTGALVARFRASDEGRWLANLLVAAVRAAALPCCSSCERPLTEGGVKDGDEHLCLACGGA
jgi:hypothetical protein